VSVTSTIVHRAQTRFIQATDILRPYVGCFWIITAEPGATLRIVPDGTTSISIELRERSSSGWVLRGPLLRPAVRRFPSPSILVGIRLRPGAAVLVSGMAADSIVGRRVRLKGLAFRSLSCDELHALTPEQLIDELQSFLIDRLANARVHPAVAAAVREIERGGGCLRVAEIADACSVSPRHLSRLMRAWVGYGPKVLGRIIRFQATLKQMENLPGRSGAALASETGYFDQAHLTRDTGRLAGATPAHLASRCVADFYKTRCEDPL
jgi:AraC-like DNA-binding protein